VENWVIGIDLGATKIALGLVNPENKIVARRRIPTNVADGPESAVDRIVENIATLGEVLPENAKIAAVGICSPGPVDHKAGMIVDPPNLTGWINVPFQQMLIEKLNLPVVLEHDAKAAAMGEFHYGAGQGEEHMVYIVTGTGVGAAIIINGQLYRGMHNFAGEIGQLTIDRDGEIVGNNVQGCVQEYLCGPALARNYLALASDAQVLDNQNEITGKKVVQMAAAGDKLALQIVTDAGEALGIAVGSLSLILDIELYVVGGSVAKAGNMILQPAREILDYYCLQSIADHIRIEPVSLGDDGPILGCAWFAKNALNSD
jgi:glucokinase